jgi:dihydroorotate dehydrogenase
MKDYLCGMFYNLLRNFLFLFDAEKVHHFSMNCLQLVCKVPLLKKILTSAFAPKNSIPINVLGLNFKNPVGLAAGFDKNAKYLNELEALGFGCVEIGTVTPLAQDGNPTPRLFRLPKDKALINRMGFNNEGVDVVAKRLKDWRVNNDKLRVTNYEFKKQEPSIQNNQSTKHNHQPEIQNQKPSTINFQLIIGGNIGKNKITPNENAWKDYEICFNALHDYVDYFVVNVSSPNTPGLRELQEKEPLKKILTHLQMLNKNFANQKPILLKIAPDLTQSQIDDVIELAQEINLDGLVVANTSLDRSKLITEKTEVDKIGMGGLSGMPVKARATEMIKYIHQKTNGKIPIIASGGIFTGADAAEKLQAGASLVQVWTGFVYEGPAIVKKIMKEIK